MTRQRYYIRIPHQLQVTVGIIPKGERVPALHNHDAENWAFYHDSHITMVFASKREMKKWAETWRGHKWAEVRAKVAVFLA